MVIFTGSNDDAIQVLIFLAKKHPDQCQFFLRDVIVKKKSWVNTSLIWDGKKIKFQGKDVQDHGFVSKILKCKHQFLILPLMLVDPGYTIMHANFLVLDLLEETVEHFEPYGNTPEQFGDAHSLNESLQVFTTRVFPKGRFVQPKVSEGKGLQARQELESQITKTKSRPPGFCLAWAALYASVRLSSPLERPECMADKMLQLAQGSGAVTLTSFIDDFAHQIIN